MRKSRGSRGRRLTYANVAATVALVLAMSGGAFAASRYLLTSTKQIKPSVLAKLKGSRGPAGTAGTPGTHGATGATGATGNTGGANPNATSVDGFTVQKILTVLSPNTGFIQVYAADGLTLLEECTNTGSIGLDYQSSYTNANLQAAGGMDGVLLQPLGGTTGTGNVALVTPGSHAGNVSIDYANTVGQSVSVTLGFSYAGPFNTGSDCGVWGVGTSAG
ncbi:MAG TPA: hypothetical protein VHM72_00585 [Solirubrobacteraceae bacterium]|nr:hypothetical protein [Solirubrobacteraceae bacterium]